jgi:hypothetical protein
MELNEKYEELTNIVDTLESLILDLNAKYMDNYISELLFTIDEAKKEMIEVEQILMEENEIEKKIEEQQYYESKLGGYC